MSSIFCRLKRRWLTNCSFNVVIRMWWLEAVIAHSLMLATVSVRLSSWWSPLHGAQLRRPGRGGGRGYLSESERAGVRRR
jgi:hypothetical protein